MFKVALQLYIISFDLSSNEQCFVSMDKTKLAPLCKDINEGDMNSIEQILQSVFEEYIDLGFGWVSPKLINADKNDDKLTITYACSIPPKTLLKNSYYISKNISIIDNLARKSLYYV